METRNGYVYGSAAPKLHQGPERQEAHQPKESRVRVSRAAVSPYAHVPKAKLIFCIVALAAMCFVVLYRFTILSDLNTAMNKLNEQYDELRDQNRRLKVEIETSIDLDKVQQIAETELGMHKPDQYQIVAVSVPKNDYNVVLDQEYIDETSGSGKTFIEGILDTIRAAFPR